MNDGAPLARLPKPAVEPHMTSEISSSSASSLVFLSWANELVVENRSTREFMVRDMIPSALTRTGQMYFGIFGARDKYSIKADCNEYLI